MDIKWFDLRQLFFCPSQWVDKSVKWMCNICQRTEPGTREENNTDHGKAAPVLFLFFSFWQGNTNLKINHLAVWPEHQKKTKTKKKPTLWYWLSSLVHVEEYKNTLHLKKLRSVSFWMFAVRWISECHSWKF